MESSRGQTGRPLICLIKYATLSHPVQKGPPPPQKRDFFAKGLLIFLFFFSLLNYVLVF